MGLLRPDKLIFWSNVDENLKIVQDWQHSDSLLALGHSDGKCQDAPLGSAKFFSHSVYASRVQNIRGEFF